MSVILEFPMLRCAVLLSQSFCKASASGAKQQDLQYFGGLATGSMKQAGIAKRKYLEEEQDEAKNSI